MLLFNNGTEKPIHSSNETELNTYRFTISKVLLVSCLFISILFLSIFPRLYILNETNHHCSGKECPICMEIEAIAQVSNTLQSSYQVIPSIVAILLVILLSISFFSYEWCHKTTLITLKVELLD